MNPDLSPAPKFSRGDAVRILSGDRAGQTGSIIAVYRADRYSSKDNIIYRVLLDKRVNGAHHTYSFRETVLRPVDIVTRLAALAS